MRQQDYDDDYRQRTSSVLSSSAPVQQPPMEQKQSLLTNPSTNVKVCISFSIIFYIFLVRKQIGRFIITFKSDDSE
jgi:hypothetical protein